MNELSPDMRALFHQSVEESAHYSFEDRLKLITDLHRRPPIVFRAPGAQLIGKKAMRAAGYMRNSHGDQEVNTSIDRQFEKFPHFAAQNMLTLTKLYADPDTSGRTWIERPGFLNMLLDARAGMFDVLLIEDPDRLARGAFMGLAFEILDALNIPVVELPSGRVHTAESIMLHNFVASRELKKITVRTTDGAARSVKHRGKIVKLLAYGHKRQYPRGPVMKHPQQAAIVLEAHTLFDSGLTAGQIAHIFNRKLAAGDTNYVPPGFHLKGPKMKVWRRGHFIAGGKHECGLLTNVQCRGIFISGKTLNSFDNMSASKDGKLLSREDWNEVIDDKLEIVPKDLFERNYRRIQSSKEDFNNAKKARKEQKPANPPAPENRYGSNGKRRLLSQLVCCGVCNMSNYTFYTRKERIVMLCGGRGNLVCNQGFEVDERTLTAKLIDIVEDEISSAGSLALFRESFAEQTSDVVGELVLSKEDLNRQLVRLREDLEDNRQEARSAVSETAKDHYRKTAADIDRQMSELETRLLAAENPAKVESSRDDDIDQARSLLDRLRHPHVTLSQEADDIWIVQMFRRMCSLKVVPNSHDYGAAAHVEIDFSSFFLENPSIMPKRDFTRRFVIHMPPKICRPRRVPITRVNLKMLHAPDRYRLSEKEWTALQEVLRPAWSVTKGKLFSRQKRYYDSIFLNLRAGAGPNTMHGTEGHQSIAMVCRQLREQKLWPALLETLGKFGNGWIDAIDPGLVEYLHGKGGHTDAPWTVEDANS